MAWNTLSRLQTAVKILKRPPSTSAYVGSKMEPFPPPRARPRGRWVRILSGLACLAIIAFVAVFVVRPNWRAYVAWRHVEAALSADDLSLTRSALEDYLRLWPSSGRAHFLLARALRRTEDFSATRRHLKEARRHQWPTVALDLEYKLLQAQAGGVRAAETALQEYLEADHPDSAFIFEALVIGYLRNNLLNDAHHWASAWNQRWPGNWRCQMLLGQVLERGLKLSLAADAYALAFELNPNDIDVRHRLAQSLLHLGKFPEALPHFEAYRAVRPDDDLAVVGQGRCLRALARGDEAQALIDHYLTNNKATSPLLTLRGQLASDRERYEEAHNWLRKAHTLAPDDRELLQALADVTRRLGQTETSSAYENRRKEIEALTRQVEALIKEVVTAEVARDQPRDRGKIAELRSRLGLALVRLGKDAEASQWLVGALQLEPGHPAARKALDEVIRRREKR